MTISVGILCKEGVLLCADTEETSWATKSHASKIRDFAFPGGHVAFAYAGNTRFAASAVQQCKRHLTRARASKKRVDAFSEIQSVLDKEYRRNVLSNPSRDTDHELHYWLLVALWTENDKARLYVSEKTALAEVVTFECIGIGEPLARHLIRSAHSPEMGYCEALPLAGNALSLVKNQMRDCDGMSVFSLLDNDGGVSVKTSMSPGVCSEVEAYSAGFDFLCRRLFVHMMDPTRDDQFFELNLDSLFTNEVRRIFAEVVAQRRQREGTLAKLNPGLTPDQVRRLDRQLTIGYPRFPQPSPETLGGSNES